MPENGRSPTNNELDWVRQRQLWNTEGYCAREACGRPHAGHVYRNDHALKYCSECAYSLVVAQGNVIEWQGAARPYGA